MHVCFCLNKCTIVAVLSLDLLFGMLAHPDMLFLSTPSKHQ